MVERSTQIDTLSAFLVLPSSCHSRTTIYRQAFPVSALSSMTIIISFFVFQGSTSRLGISKAKCFRIHIANVDIRTIGTCGGVFILSCLLWVMARNTKIPAILAFFCNYRGGHDFPSFRTEVNLSESMLWVLGRQVFGVFVFIPSHQSSAHI